MNSRLLLLFGLIILFFFPIQNVHSQQFNLNWAYEFGGGWYDYPSSVHYDSQGNIYLTGQFSSQIDFDPGPNTHNLQASGSNDGFILKLDTSGNFVWAVNIGGSIDEDGINNMAIDAQGNLYITGHFFGLADFNPAPGPNNYDTLTGSTGFGRPDGFLLKLDHNGNFRWVRHFKSGNLVLPTKLKMGLNNDLFFTLTYRDSVILDPISSNNSLKTRGPYIDEQLIVVMDSSGNLKNYKVMNETTLGRISDFALSSTGQLYCVGYFRDSIDLNPDTSNRLMVYSNGGNDFFLQELDTALNFISGKSFGGSGDDYGASISLDVNSNLYLTGHFSDSVDFDPNGGQVIHSKGGKDAFIQKLNSNGQLLWVANSGGPNDDGITEVSINSQNQVFWSGYMSDSIQLLNSNLNKTIRSLGMQDTYLGVIDSSGTILNIQNIGCSQNDYGTYIVENNGSLFIAGYFRGNCDFDPGIGTTNINSVYYDDIYLLKMQLSPMITSLSTRTKETSLKAYPNPFQEQLTIELEKEEEILLFQLFDLQGKEVFNAQLRDVKSFHLNIEIPNGSYIGRLELKDEVITVPLIKQ